MGWLSWYLSFKIGFFPFDFRCSLIIKEFIKQFIFHFVLSLVLTKVVVFPSYFYMQIFSFNIWVLTFLLIKNCTDWNIQTLGEKKNNNETKENKETHNHHDCVYASFYKVKVIPIWIS